jgi:hypothetical protein
MSWSLRTVERAAVATDQVTAAPPGAPGAAGAGRHARGLLLEAVQAAVHGDLDEGFAGDGRAQGLRQDVLRDVQGSGPGVVEGDLTHHLLAPHRPPSGPAGTRPGQRRTGETFREGRGVLAQDDGARGTRLVLARPFVQDDARHLLARQCQGERESDGSRSDDDHRVHGAAPPARGDDVEDEGEQEGGAGCTITERMQPIAGACVKRRRQWRSCHCLRVPRPSRPGVSRCLWRRFRARRPPRPR